MHVKESSSRDESFFVLEKLAAINGQRHFRPAIRENTNDVLSRNVRRKPQRASARERACNRSWNGALPSTRGIYIARIFVKELTWLVVAVVVVVVVGSLRLPAVSEHRDKTARFSGDNANKSRAPTEFR